MVDSNLKIKTQLMKQFNNIYLQIMFRYRKIKNSAQNQKKANLLKDFYRGRLPRDNDVGRFKTMSGTLLLTSSLKY